MYLQVRDPNPNTLRVGDLLYDLVNNLQWVITNVNKDARTFEMVFNERTLGLCYANSIALDTYILIRQVEVDV